MDMPIVAAPVSNNQNGHHSLSVSSSSIITSENNNNGITNSNSNGSNSENNISSNGNNSNSNSSNSNNSNSSNGNGSGSEVTTTTTTTTNSNSNSSSKEEDSIDESEDLKSSNGIVNKGKKVTISSYANSASNSNNGKPQKQIEETLACPICLDIIKEPFITKCGHSFCYQCLLTHLSKQLSCPLCMHFLTREHIFPNFALNKFVETMSQSNHILSTPPVKQLQNTLLTNEALSINDINSMVAALLEKKKLIELQDQQVELDILLDFLIKTKSQKMEAFRLLKKQISLLNHDIESIEVQQKISGATSNNNNNNNNSNNNNNITTTTTTTTTTTASTNTDENNNNINGDNIKIKNEPNSILNSDNISEVSKEHLKEGGISGSIFSNEGSPSNSTPTTTTTTNSKKEQKASATVVKKRKIDTHLDDLQSCYFSAYDKEPPLETDTEPNQPKKLGKGLLSFSRNLSKFTRYSDFRVVTTLKYGDLSNTSSIVSSIEFDKDDEFFATAGVTKKIKVFEYAQLSARDHVDVHVPVKEMTCRSKISCLSWNTYIKSQIASSDYEGIITLWDVNTGADIMSMEEHEKRVWSVDFSRTDPTQLASGSDDTRVKLWSTTSKRAITTIESKANICCVKFNPSSSHLIAFGSADHHIHYYDLRHPKEPLSVFKGHRKAVSYVKFMNRDEIISASTDSTLKLWNVNQNDSCVRTYVGHANEKNFVGLTVSGDYICCGSENNGVYTYYKTLSKPIVTHRFGANSGSGEETDDDGSQFVSSVCWKKDSNILLAANSQGNIKVLELY